MTPCRLATLVALALAWSSAAHADVGPPPDWKDPCVTAGPAPGDDCIRCNTPEYKDSACHSRAKTDGYAERCRGWNYAWFCRAAAPSVADPAPVVVAEPAPATPAPAAEPAPVVTPAPAPTATTAPATTAPSKGCAGAEPGLSGLVGLIGPSGVVVALGLLAVRARRRAARG